MDEIIPSLKFKIRTRDEKKKKNNNLKKIKK
jgi:hypothetical protein